MSIFDDEKTVHFTGALRCAKAKYNKDLVDKGCIKFGTPQSWIDNGKKYGPGRGDVLEGTFATCNLFDIENMKQLASKYDLASAEIVKEIIGDRIYYKRKSSLYLPAFCIYGVKYDLFDIKPQTGWQEIKGIIPGEYFKSFADNIEEFEKLPDDEKPSVVWIKDLDTFKERVITKLLDLGVSKNEIIVSVIKYYDFNTYGPTGWIELTATPPNELTLKDIYFKPQSEIRFIVNTNNQSILDHLHKDPITIGNISDIAQILTGYFPDGLGISMKINVEEKV